MKKIHKEIMIHQARLMDRVIARVVCTKIKPKIDHPTYKDKKEFRKVVASNNLKFSPFKGIVPALTVGQKAKIARLLVRSEMRDVHSHYSLVDWSNTFSVKLSISAIYETTIHQNKKFDKPKTQK